MIRIKANTKSKIYYSLISIILIGLFFIYHQYGKEVFAFISISAILMGLLFWRLIDPLIGVIHHTKDLT